MQRVLRLSFERRERAFSVKAVLDADAPVTGEFVIPVTNEELLAVLAELGETRSLTETVEAEIDDARAVAPEPPTTRAAQLVPRRQRTAEDFGTALADALFTGEVGSLFEKARRIGDVQLRIALTEEQTELLQIPWEFLCRKGIFVAMQPRTPVLRELWVGDDEPVTREPPEKIRILTVSSSPTGLEPLNTHNERANLEAVVAAHADAAELEWIDGCTYDELHDALGRHPHVLHFVGHSFCDDNGEAGLVLCKPDGTPHLVSARAFANLVGRAETIELIVLNSCEGFRAVAGHPYASLAAKLVRAGQSAVIAMQFKITDDAAIKFSGELYERIIADRMSIDHAVSEARVAVMGVNEMEFATPVLYLRDGKADLFRATPGTVAVPASVTLTAAAKVAAHGNRLGDRLLKLTEPNMVGDDVADLQARLARAGVDCGPVDGLFGAKTASAVESFQRVAGLAVDGACGPSTIAALDRAGTEQTTIVVDRPPAIPADTATATLGAPNVTGANRLATPVPLTPPGPPDPAAAPGPPDPVPPVAPAAAMPPVSRSNRGGQRGLRIGAGIAVAVLVTAVVVVALTGRGNDNATGTSASGGATVTEPPSAVDPEYFGLVVDFPRLPIIPTYVVAHELADQVPSAEDCGARLDWARDNGALVADGESFFTTAGITLQATDELTDGVGVALTNVRVEVLDWLPPLAGGRITCQQLAATDAGAPILVDIALPELPGDPADVEFGVDRDGSGLTEPTSEFPRQILRPGETIFFDLDIDSTPCDCEWFVILDMVVDGERMSIEIGNEDGSPFRTTGPDASVDVS